MEEYEMTCKDCKKKFLVRVYTMNVPGCKDKEEISCPYCKSENGYRMTSGYVDTYKIENEED